MKKRQTAKSENVFETLSDRLDDQLKVNKKAITETQEDRNRLVEIATSFLLLQSTIGDPTRSRSPRSVGLIAAAAGAAGGTLEDPVKYAALSALSIFSMCSDKKVSLADVENSVKQHTVIHRTLKRVQTRNDENFFLLGNEYQETHESVPKILRFFMTTCKI